MRKIVLIFITIVLLLSLYSCADLDDMRAHQGFWTDDGNVLLGEKVYVKLPYSRYINPTTKWESLYITDMDVPVLLSNAQYDETMEISIDGTMLSNIHTFYCLEEKYDEYLKVVQSEFVPDGYVAEYTNYDNHEYDYDYVTLPDEVCDIINEVWDSKENKKTDQEYFDYECVTVYSYMYNENFKKEEFNIYYYNSDYVITTPNDYVAYPVPDEYEEALDKAFEGHDIKWVYTYD